MSCCTMRTRIEAEGLDWNGWTLQETHTVHNLLPLLPASQFQPIRRGLRFFLSR